MKTFLLSLSIGGLLFGAAEPIVAQAAGFDPLSSNTQLGICGLALGIVLIAFTRTIPGITKANAVAARELSRDMKDGFHEMATEISGLRSDFHEQAERTAARAERLNDTLLEALSVKKP